MSQSEETGAAELGPDILGLTPARVSSPVLSVPNALSTPLHLPGPEPAFWNRSTWSAELRLHPFPLGPHGPWGLYVTHELSLPGLAPGLLPLSASSPDCASLCLKGGLWGSVPPHIAWASGPLQEGSREPPHRPPRACHHDSSPPLDPQASP